MVVDHSIRITSSDSMCKEGLLSCPFKVGGIRKGEVWVIMATQTSKNYDMEFHNSMRNRFDPITGLIKEDK